MATKRKHIDEIEDNLNEEILESEEDSNSDNETGNRSMQQPESNEECDSFDDSDDHEENHNEEGNLRWADSIAKILKSTKPKNKKDIILSRAKKLTDISTAEVTKPAGFQVETTDGKIKEETITVSEKSTVQHAKRKKKEITSVRKKPNVLENNRERTLLKLATKGIVHLFNAVKNKQKDISAKLEDAGPLEVKRDKVLKNLDKNEFLNILRNNTNLPEVEVKTDSKMEGNGSTWNVLREDFMMGAKIKDWDKELEGESDD